MEDHKPKFSLPEIILVSPFFIINDVVGIILIIFGLDDFFILDVLRFPLSQIYLRIKGVRGSYMLIGNILEAIPYIGALPNATICWFITVWLANHPETTARLQKAAQLSKKEAQAPAQKPSAPTPKTTTTTAPAALKIK